MTRSSVITDIKGVGTKTKEAFEKIGVYTVGDILLHFPRTYIQYPVAKKYPSKEIFEQEICAIRATIMRTPIVKRTRIPVTLLQIGDSAEYIQLIWYRMPYIKNSLVFGQEYVFYGKLIQKEGRFIMEQPTIYSVEQYEQMEACFLPVYSLSVGLTNNLIMKTIKNIFSDSILFDDFLPDHIRKKQRLCEYNYAIKQIHFPDSMDALIEARKRLVFDEFFLFIMGMRYQKEKQIKESNHFELKKDGFVDDLIRQLPYNLTNAQMKVISEISNDMLSPYVMQRLIQGDVGSGKTIVAFLMMSWCAYSGYQSAIMAPTEVLAKQHYETFCSLCKQFGLDYQVILLTGSMTPKQKRDAYENIQNNPNAMVIGTHALIQEKTLFTNLALVITDEQHRFGVRQRETFSEKGEKPHILVMSATPIPRTLAIIIYGDMDISVIDEVPAKRLPIKNCVVDIKFREKSYSFIEEQIKEGRQAYVICPLVEETEHMDAENVTDYMQKLNHIFGDAVSVGMLHGKMKSEQKNEIMDKFSNNEIQVLVSTTVVEVGVNVPNATVIMIENADRFGLAQLHQLRGRVGRGDAQSYCIMINTSNSKATKKRLEILNRSNDGFYIASEDLKFRGPGDFFGIRQCGDFSFKLADIYQDANVLQQASEAVNDILKADPKLENEEYNKLRLEIQFKNINL